MTSSSMQDEAVNSIPNVAIQEEATPRQALFQKVSDIPFASRKHSWVWEHLRNAQILK